MDPSATSRDVVIEGRINVRRLTLNILEGCFLFGILAINLFHDYDTAARYGASQVFSLHTISLVVSVWMDETDRLHNQLRRRDQDLEALRAPLWLMRLMLVCVDALAIVRTGEGLSSTTDAPDVAKFVLLCALGLIALGRLWEVGRWADRDYLELRTARIVQ